MGTELRKAVGHTATGFRLLSIFDLGGLHYEKLLIIRSMRLVGNFVINTVIGWRRQWHCMRSVQCKVEVWFIAVFAVGPRKGTCEEPE